MRFLYFSLPAGLTLRVISDEQLKFDGRTRFLAQAYVPGIMLINNPDPRKADITIEYKLSTKERLTRRGNYLTVYGQWDGEYPLDLWHLIYSAVRISLLYCSLFSVHAACVESDGYILIAGHSGTGKTSIILRLARENGLRIFSGNKTVVSFMKNGALGALAGTPVITTRTADFKKNSGLAEQVVAYGDRRAFILDKKRYSEECPAHIRAIVIARLNDGVRECEKISPPSALHKLYPYFMDMVNADTIVCGGKDVFVGTPPAGTEKFLAKKLKCALSKIPVYVISGSLSFVTSSIKKI